jgi:hypothetical protein
LTSFHPCRSARLGKPEFAAIVYLTAKGLGITFEEAVELLLLAATYTNSSDIVDAAVFIMHPDEVREGIGVGRIWTFVWLAGSWGCAKRRTGGWMDRLLSFIPFFWGGGSCGQIDSQTWSLST